mgnify:CR=1 FL=1
MTAQSPSSPSSSEKSSVLSNQIIMAALLEHAPFRIFFKDVDRRFIAVGREKLRWHGFTIPSEIIGKSDDELCSSEHAQRSRDEEDYILRTGETVVGADEKNIGNDGEINWGRSTKLPLRDEQGQIIGTFGYSDDITKEKELGESLNKITTAMVDASRMAGMAEVATGVLHNVGNVLNSLNVSSSIVTSGLRQSKAESLAKVGLILREHRHDLGHFLTEDPKGKRVPEFLESLSQHFSTERTRLLEEIEAMCKNIDHIKEIVSMQQSYASVAGNTEPLEPASLMADALRMNGDTLGRNLIKITQDFPTVPKIMAEKGKVLQILVNLIRNSKHACDETGRPDKDITLRVALGELGRVLLIVQDNGIGIPSENLTKVFQHGFTTKATGHGFGVHSSALAAKEMKGSLTVHSDGPGQGAIFTLELPAAPQKPHA